jgi:hypothetical protein
MIGPERIGTQQVAKPPTKKRVYFMQIFLNPNHKEPDLLRDVYRRAFKQAEEICLATAYLTDWDLSHKLNPKCKRLTFLVGTDFGLTRKAAMLSVLKWIPKSTPFSFFGAVL